MTPIPFSVQAAITRPVDTNQYTAKDVVNGEVATCLEFRFLVPFPDIGYWIMSPVLISSNPAATSGSFKLLLFRSRPTTPIDHAVFAPTNDQLGSFIGVITFDTAILVSTGTIYVPDGFKPLWGLCTPGGNDIYGVLLDDNGYTPVSLENFRIVLNGQWEAQ